MTAYDPQSPASRRALASAITQKLTAGHFRKIPMEGTTEDVYVKPLPEDARLAIAVYTSITHGTARAVGADAIRVTLLYKRQDGSIRGLAKETRINRTGTIEAIIDRMVDRIYLARNLAKSVPHCEHCRAPKFTSKAGKLVCADACWVGRTARRNGIPYERQEELIRLARSQVRRISSRLRPQEVDEVEQMVLEKVFSKGDEPNTWTEFQAKSIIRQWAQEAINKHRKQTNAREMLGWSESDEGVTHIEEEGEDYAIQQGMAEFFKRLELASPMTRKVWLASHGEPPYYKPMNRRAKKAGPVRSAQEVGQLLGIPPGAVGGHLKQANAILVGWLQEIGEL